MQIKILRQILKACSDDTRLRIINLLRHSELTVKQICNCLHITQTTISKHLAKLRSLKMVRDVRVGNSVFYSLNTDTEMAQGTIINFLLSRFAHIDTFVRDVKLLPKQRGGK